MTTVTHSTPRGRSTAEPSTPLVEVVVGQELEGAGLRRFAALLDDALGMRPVRLVVDLGGSRVLDSGALHVLLSAHRRLWLAGGRLVLRSVSTTHARNIALAGLQSVFEVAPPGPGAAAAGAGAAVPAQPMPAR